jgi:hypothetical protein
MEEKDFADNLEDKFINLYADRYSLKQLEGIRDELVKRNEDSSIIDKAIEIKLKYKADKEKEEKEFERKVRIVNKQAFWSGLLGGLASGKKLNSDLTSWEMQEMINNDLEESNFEEEIEDEDDFYSDDLD